MSPISTVARTAGCTIALVLSAWVMSFAVSSQQHLPLAVLGLLPLLRIIQVVAPRRATVCGAGWGALLALFLSAQSSLGLSNGGLLVPMAFAAYTGLGAWITRRWGYSPLVLAVGWFFIEIALRPLSLSQGVLVGSPESGVLLASIGQVFGYAWVAFILVFASAWLLSVVSRIRFDLSPPVVLPGLGDGQRGLWPLNPALRPCHVAVPSHPRAPPFAG
jgi:apolipoprotein N-acyltransferase